MQNNNQDLARQQQESVSIAISNPLEFIKNLPVVERSVGIATCVSGKTLKALERENLGKELKISLDLQLMRLANSLNLSKNITETQVEIIVQDLIEMFPYETLEDFILVFKRMRQGYYGEFYSRLDGAVIIGCMRQHLEEKALYREKMHQKQKTENKDLDIENVIASYQKGNPLRPTLGETKADKDEKYRVLRQEYFANLEREKKANG